MILPPIPTTRRPLPISPKRACSPTWEFSLDILESDDDVTFRYILWGFPKTWFTTHADLLASGHSPRIPCRRASTNLWADGLRIPFTDTGVRLTIRQPGLTWELDSGAPTALCPGARGVIPAPIKSSTPGPIICTTKGYIYFIRFFNFIHSFHLWIHLFWRSQPRPSWCADNKLSVLSSSHQSDFPQLLLS